MAMFILKRQRIQNTEEALASAVASLAFVQISDGHFDFRLSHWDSKVVLASQSIRNMLRRHITDMR